MYFALSKLSLKVQNKKVVRTRIFSDEKNMFFFFQLYFANQHFEHFHVKVTFREFVKFPENFLCANYSPRKAVKT